MRVSADQTMVQAGIGAQNDQFPWPGHRGRVIRQARAEVKVFVMGIGEVVVGDDRDPVGFGREPGAGPQADGAQRQAHSADGSRTEPRPTVAGAGRRGKRSDLADGRAETLFTESLQAAPGERSGCSYEKATSAGGNMGQARRITAALVADGKVETGGTTPHNRYSLASS